MGVLISHQIYGCPVILHPDNLLFSHSTDSMMDDFRPDIAFISAAGVHREHGVTCYNLSEVSDKRKALKNSKHKCS